jgi:N-hydroxyarylamine O-acetyltransferase
MRPVSLTLNFYFSLPYIITMKFNVSKYLQRIGINDPPDKSFSFLIKLHRAHMITVPFENLSIHQKESIVLIKDFLYNKIVMNRRGGFCYELNYLFSQLLKSLGYEVKIISARVFSKSGIPGPEYDHMALLVFCEGREWLCDIGFGDSFIEPVEFAPGTIKNDITGYYRITVSDDNYFLLSSSEDMLKWEDQYLFTSTERSVEEFMEMCRYHQTSPDSHFTRKRVCTLAAESGRITLTDDKLIITKDKIKYETPVERESSFKENLKKYFNISLDETEEIEKI